MKCVATSIHITVRCTPLSKEYPWLSPFIYAENRPIKAIDLDGLEAWDGPNDAKDIFSLESYREFASTLLKKLDSDDNSLTFDCADLGLYLLAKYYQHMKAEFKYTIPGTKTTISSNDPQYQAEGKTEDERFEEFFSGIPSKGDRYKFGLRDHVGAKHLDDARYGFVEKIDAGAAGIGDIISSSDHVMVFYPGNDVKEGQTRVIQGQPGQVNLQGQDAGSFPTVETYNSGLRDWTRKRWTAVNRANIEKVTPKRVTNFLEQYEQSKK